MQRLEVRLIEAPAVANAILRAPDGRLASCFLRIPLFWRRQNAGRSVFQMGVECAAKRNGHSEVGFLGQ